MSVSELSNIQYVKFSETGYALFDHLGIRCFMTIVLIKSLCTNFVIFCHVSGGNYIVFLIFLMCIPQSSS